MTMMTDLELDHGLPLLGLLRELVAARRVLALLPGGAFALESRGSRIVGGGEQRSERGAFMTSLRRCSEASLLTPRHLTTPIGAREKG